MFHTYVATVYFKCFICVRRMLHPSVSCRKCFTGVWLVMGARPGRRGWDAVRWVSVDGSRPHGERGVEGAGHSDGARCACKARVRRTGAGCTAIWTREAAGATSRARCMCDSKRARWRQAARVSGYALPSGCLGTSHAQGGAAGERSREEGVYTISRFVSIKRSKQLSLKWKLAIQILHYIQ
jgi:hypothetical protein